MNNFPRPEAAEVAHHAHELGFSATEQHVNELVDALDEALGSYRLLDDLAEKDEPLSSPATGVRRPTAAEDPFHAWEWKFDLQTSQSGPLAGVTVAVKATIEVAGVPVSLGNELVSHIPRRHSIIVERLLAAGATIAGTTRLTDFENDGSGVTGSPHPLTDNAARPGFLPGGSSSGSATAVVAGDVDVAIGGDSGGSIREPASWSGCVGLKPTHGLVPAAGPISYDPILSDVGPMAQTVRDCARVLNVIADGSIDYTADLDGDLAGWRIGVLEDGFAIPGESDPEVDSTVRAFVDSLAAAGATIIPVKVEHHRAGVAVWSGIANEGTYTYVAETAKARPTNRTSSPVAYMDAIGKSLRDSPARYPFTRASMLVLGRYLSQMPTRSRYSVARELASALRRDYDRALDLCDVLLMPTTPAASRRPPSNEMSKRELLRAAAGSFHNAAPFNATGHPAISIPAGTAGGLPVGAMLVGRHHDEAQLLQIAHRAQLSTGLEAGSQHQPRL